jgi:hypothetical protein
MHNKVFECLLGVDRATAAWIAANFAVRKGVILNSTCPTLCAFPIEERLGFY